MQSWWGVVLSTFVSVFLAELGDKTQLATLGLAAGRSKGAVFCGAASALVTTTLLAVMGGELVARWVRPVHLVRASGALFIALGTWTLVSSFRSSG
jgi:putative Ca2+/H+ antiporter (TMEM165/GDT1 family)